MEQEDNIFLTGKIPVNDAGIYASKIKIGSFIFVIKHVTSLNNAQVFVLVLFEEKLFAIPVLKNGELFSERKKEISNIDVVYLCKTVSI